MREIYINEDGINIYSRYGPDNKVPDQFTITIDGVNYASLGSFHLGSMSIQMPKLSALIDALTQYRDIVSHEMSKLDLG